MWHPVIPGDTRWLRCDRAQEAICLVSRDLVVVKFKATFGPENPAIPCHQASAASGGYHVELAQPRITACGARVSWQKAS